MRCSPASARLRRGIDPPCPVRPRDQGRDPAVERLIAKCLDPDAAKRPQSALAVARALPGGDPLAEALAAGDTPSPEMVAASEDTGALSVRAAVVCMAFVVVGLIALLLLSSRTSVLRLTPFPNLQEILGRQGREIAARMGYTNPPTDSFDASATKTNTTIGPNEISRKRSTPRRSAWGSPR